MSSSSRRCGRSNRLPPPTSSRSPTLTPADISVDADGTVRSTRYGDVYHSRSGALAQARHVFLGGNGLLGDSPRWRERNRFTILETGFGIGVNFLATWSAWRESGSTGQLHYVAIEKHPAARAELAAIYAGTVIFDPSADAHAQALCQVLVEQWPLPIAGVHRMHFDDDRVTLTLVFGDAMTMLPQLTLSADALFLDGFAPDKNPDMWSARMLGALTRLCADRASLATWCVNGEVRRHLGYRGWLLERAPGFAGKRHMLRGVLSRPEGAVSPAPTCAGNRSTPYPANNAIVLGAGMAGCTISERLCARGWHVTLVDRHAQAAQEASGNPAGIVLPRLALDDALAARLARSAFLYALHTLRRLDDQQVRWSACGVLQMAEDADDESYQAKVVQRLGLPDDFVKYLPRDQAAARTGLPLKHGGWWFPSGAWVAPPSYCQALITHAGPNLTTRFGASVGHLHRNGNAWQVLDVDRQCIAEAPHLILANAHAANPLLAGIGSPPLPTETIRGQVSFLPPDALMQVNSVVCGAAYVTPPSAGQVCVGATFDRNDSDTCVRQSDHARNLATLAGMLTDTSVMRDISTEALAGRTGFRCMSHDKLPIVGALPAGDEAPGHGTTLATLPRLDGLHVLLGLGARGLLWAPLAAELLASQLNGDALPLERPLSEALDPGRFRMRARRGAAS